MNRIAVYSFLFLMISSCSLFQEVEDPDIDQILFSRNRFLLEPYKGYDAGAPVVISANTYPSRYKSPARIYVTSSSGEFTVVRLNTLHRISGPRLALILEDHEGSATLTVKESDRKRAYDDQLHRYTTSEETLSKVREWVDNMEGVEIVGRIFNSPVLVLQMTPTAEIVNELRASKNVEILEPNYRPIWLSAGSGTENEPLLSQTKLPGEGENPMTVLGVFPTTTKKSEAAFYVQPGDTLTATYHHPDGSTIETWTTIR
ncbi:hypothetical protein BH23BAC3_BH23BAC3_34140 [soil metagenome]